MHVLAVVLGLIFILAGALYKRYVPVKGTPCIECIDHYKDDDSILVLDVRDFQEASKDSFHNSMNIPYAYLKRYNHEIPKKRLVLIADSFLLANLTVRFLRIRKFEIAGVYFTGNNPTNKRSCCQWDIGLTPKKRTN